MSLRNQPLNRTNMNQRIIENDRNPNTREISTLKDFKQRLQTIDFNIDEPDLSEQAIIMVINLLKYFDEIEIQAIKESDSYRRDHHIIDDDNDNDVNYHSKNKKAASKEPRLIDGLPESRASVLIFVPGMNEIHQVKDLIDKEFRNKNLNVLPLHSDIAIDQQNRVFYASEPTYRKVIISTSIAESSITVPGGRLKNKNKI